MDVLVNVPANESCQEPCRQGGHEPHRVAILRRRGKPSAEEVLPMDGDEAILIEGGVTKQCPPPASQPLLPPRFQALAGDCLRQGPHQRLSVL